MSDPTPHAAVRPDDYPSLMALASDMVPWPQDPPFCVVCGAEMLTEGDLGQPGRPEWHADESLNLPIGAPHE